VLLDRDLLLLPPESPLNPHGPGKMFTELPSPAQCKCKVLIKAKVGRFSRGGSGGGSAVKVGSGGDSATSDVTTEHLGKLNKENVDLEDLEEETLDELDQLVR
jgi:hypothetical protein